MGSTMEPPVLPEEERRAAKGGTPRERRAFTAARREAARARDAVRYELAETLGRTTPHRIPPEQGFASFPPDTFGPTDAVVAAVNEQFDEMGHEGLLARTNKAGFLASDLLPPEAFALDSPYMRFALSPEIVGPVATYFGLVPVLYEVDAWYSVHTKKELKSSQQWHLDPTDTMSMKVWVHCSDVGLDSGPLTALPAAVSDELADAIGYGLDKERYRVDDGKLAELEPRLVRLTGPTGTVSFIDTCSCFHMGSRVDEGGLPRRMAVFTYATPYAFNFGDHRTDAPYRELAERTSDELERLVLGAD